MRSDQRIHIAVMFYFHDRTLEEITEAYPSLTIKKAELIVRKMQYNHEILREFTAREAVEQTVTIGHKEQPYSDNEDDYGLFGRDEQQFFHPPKYDYEDVKGEQA